MEDDFSLKDSTIGIFGLGLMGGSMALGLKGHCRALIGFDSDPAALELALSKNIINQASADPATLLPQVDLLIIATPVSAIINMMKQLPALTPNKCIVLDLGSTKHNIMETMSTLPERFDPIGGHPICGKEKLGLENAEENLYQNAPFIVTPLKRTTQRARNAAEQIISTVGACLIEMNSEEHDHALAFTSHLPFLLSSALIAALPQELAKLIGPGFRSTSRLAGTPSHMMMGILQSNRENILSALRNFQMQLTAIESALSSKNDSSLEAILNSTQSQYQSMIH